MRVCEHKRFYCVIKRDKGQSIRDEVTMRALLYFEKSFYVCTAGTVQVPLYSSSPLPLPLPAGVD
jgi:hypothetical protein